MSNPQVTVLCGVPASGKTTWAKSSGAGRVLSDILPCPNWARLEVERAELASEILAAGSSVVVDGCHLSRSVRLAWLGVARRGGASSRLVVFDTPSAVVLERNSKRRNPVGPDAMADYVRRWPRARGAAIHEPWDSVVVVGSPVSGNG